MPLITSNVLHILFLFYTACEDESGNTYTAGSTFIMNKDFHCWQCQCEMRNGALNARCYRKYCPTLECPPDSQVKEKGSCCSKCKSGWGKYNAEYDPRTLYYVFAFHNTYICLYLYFLCLSHQCVKINT